MGFAFNPFTGNFDQKGSGGGGGGSAFFAGEVATYADLPLDGSAALDSRWLVRSNSGTWPFSSYKQAGVYVRKATVGASRDNDYQLTDTSFFDVMSDDKFLVFDNSDATKAMAFNVGANVPTSSTVTLTVPASSGTIALTGQLTDTKVYTANDTWTKPAGARLVHYLLIGGGGGGGAGRRSLPTNSLGGGGGGAGGGITAGYVDPAFLGSTETITIGAGGTGAVDSADNTNGAAGTAGGESSFGSFIKARGGSAGGGGSSSGGSAGAATTLASLFYGTNASTAAGASGAASSTPPSNAAASVYLPTGGGGGGGRGSSTNGVGSKGGDIGQTNTGITSAPAIAAGTNGPAGIRSQSSWAGTGGGGGSMSSDNAVHTGFSGGNGGLYGGGGGGGSGAANSAGGSNAGGAGGNGIVIVTTYF
jgi:hypothetical protein